MYTSIKIHKMKMHSYISGDGGGGLTPGEIAAVVIGCIVTVCGLSAAVLIIRYLKLKQVL